jgi:hypothetical protein
MVYYRKGIKLNLKRLESMRRVALIVGACLIRHFAGFAQIGSFDAEGEVGSCKLLGKVVYYINEHTLAGVTYNLKYIQK